MTLSTFQVDLIKCDISQHGIELRELQEDLLDHICCMLENEGKPDTPFEQAYEKIKQAYFPDGTEKFRSKQII